MSLTKDSRDGLAYFHCWTVRFFSSSFFCNAMFCVWGVGKKEEEECDLSSTTTESQHLILSRLLSHLISPLMSFCCSFFPPLLFPLALLLKTHSLHKSKDSSGGCRIITMSVQQFQAGASDLLKAAT